MRKQPKITNYTKNVQKSPNQNHKRCVTKSQNKSQQKSLNVEGDINMASHIVSCLPTLDKCDKFGDYLDSTYVETTISPPSLWAQVSFDARRTINGPKFYHPQSTVHLAHLTFFILWVKIVKQQTVSRPNSYQHQCSGHFCACYNNC